MRNQVMFIAGLTAGAAVGIMAVWQIHVLWGSVAVVAAFFFGQGIAAALGKEVE